MLNSLIDKERILTEIFSDYNVIEVYASQQFTMDKEYDEFVFVSNTKSVPLRLYSRLLECFPMGLLYIWVDNSNDKRIIGKRCIYRKGKWFL